MTAPKRASLKRAKRERVAHIRFSNAELSAVEIAAKRAGLTVSTFVRSLSLEGAGVRPFMSREDRALIGMLVQDMRALGSTLIQITRTLNTSGSLADSGLAGAIDDAYAITTTVAAEFTSMTKCAGAARCGGAA